MRAYPEGGQEWVYHVWARMACRRYLFVVMYDVRIARIDALEHHPLNISDACKVVQSLRAVLAHGVGSTLPRYPGCSAKKYPIAKQTDLPSHMILG